MSKSRNKARATQRALKHKHNKHVAEQPIYLKDKMGTVTFKNGRKVKLRKYVAEVSAKLAKFNQCKYNIARDLIIAAYDKGGTKEISRVYMKALLEIQAKVTQKTQNEQ